MTLPRVTEILRAVGLSRDYTGVPPYYAKRGTALNEAIDLDAIGELDEASLHPDLWPGIEAYRAFVRERQHVVFGSQMFVEHPAGYGGHLDRIGSFMDELRQTLPLAIIDWKYSDNPDLMGARYQLAAYRLAWEVMRADLGRISPSRVSCFVVALSPTRRTYRVHDFSNDDEAADVFLAAVKVYRAIQAGA